MALTIALFADGIALFMWDATTVLWLGIVAIASAFMGHWISRSTSASVLAVLAGAVGVLHVAGAVWSSL